MDNFKSFIEENDLVLVDFYADWCGPCKVLEPILKDVESKLSEQVTVMKIDVDMSPELATDYEIRGIPTMLLFKKGKIVWRQVGIVPYNSIKEKIESNQ